MDPLLERAGTLSTLEDRLAGVRSSSQGRLVLLGGEAGVGKTALLRRFCESVPVRVLWGACEPLRTPRPLGPLLDVAEETGGELEELTTRAARPHEVTAALLHELRRVPTVLVLEDVHWADEATLDVMTLLATRIATVPALALATYRDDEVDRAGQLRVVLGELIRRPGRLKLAPLSPAGVGELAEPYGVDGGELYRRTGGNPFFVIEVLAAGGDEMPDTVRDAVLARAARLSPPARRLLEAISVVPGQVELWLLEVLAGELIDHVDEALASGMLTAGRAHVAFRHELARVAIDDAVPPTRRVALHREALAALAAREADFTRLAHHAEAAGDVEAVRRWAPRAAERASESGAHREAAAQYARALRAGPTTDLLRRYADECYMTAQFDEAISAQRQLLESHRRDGDRLREGDAMRSLSRLLFFAGHSEEAEPLALEAVDLLERSPAGHELAMAYGNVSQRRMVIEDVEEAVSWGRRALELAERLGDIEALAYALTNLGAAQYEAEGPAQLERALALAQEHGLEEYAGRAFLHLTLLPVRRRTYDVAARRLEAGLEYCTERGLDTWRLYLLAVSSRIALDRGRWDDAAESAGMVLRDPRNAPVARGWALAVLGLLRVRRGDAEALAPLDEADVLVEATGALMRIAPVASARAELAWLTGDDETVERVTAAAFSLAAEAPWAAGELAYWRWQAGLHDEPLGAEPYRRSIAGDWAGAEALWREIGCPYEAALALAESDHEADVRRAMDELQVLGARPAARIVARRLRERGVRAVPRGPRKRTLGNPAGLTARELEVLTLLTDGLRNAQIADRLVVSERTVEHHVSAVLRKLDAHSRGEAVAKAAQLGLQR